MNSTYRFPSDNLLRTVLEGHLLKIRGLLGERIQNDPVFFPHLYSERKDIEMAAFISAQFAYGNILQIKDFLRRLFSRMEEGPYNFVKMGDLSRLDGLYYRFQKEEDIKELFSFLKLILDRYGLLGELFSKLFIGDIRKAVFSVREELKIPTGKLLFFFPSESPSNPLKRWNLFLRWMVRKDEIDFGIWGFIEPHRLLVPLDTHIFKVSTCLGWTKRKTKDSKTVFEVTEKLRLLCPHDPMRYDFLLCHFVGIDNRCPGKRTDLCKGRCILYG